MSMDAALKIRKCECGETVYEEDDYGCECFESPEEKLKKENANLRQRIGELTSRIRYKEALIEELKEGLTLLHKMMQSIRGRRGDD